MSNFLIIIGLILYFFCFVAFIFVLAVVMPKAEENERWAILPFLTMGGFIVIGTISYSIGMGMKEEQPMQLSQSCGTVIGYKYYKNCSGRSQTRCDPFERIQIRLDDSKYSRLMRFDGNLSRKNSNEYVCFTFYDRYKYSHLQDSRITQWIQ